MNLFTYSSKNLKDIFKTSFDDLEVEYRIRSKKALFLNIFKNTFFQEKYTVILVLNKDILLKISWNNYSTVVNKINDYIVSKKLIEK